MDNKKSWLNTNKEKNLNEKPIWFKEMIIDIDKNLKEEKRDELEFEDEIKINKEKNLKRRNNLNFLYNENQNFLSDLLNKPIEFKDNKNKKSLSKEIDWKKQIIGNYDKIKNELNIPESFNDDYCNKIDINDKNLSENKTKKNENITGFIIPKLPKGKKLTFVFKSNWGDENYIGLNGIEVFDAITFVDVTKKSAISTIDEKSKPEKLIDSIYRTHDENHIWKTNFIKNKDLILDFNFENQVEIALIRIWNYNKSRIYSYRGVKDVLIFLDNLKIFDGQIAKANGELKDESQKFGDTILFTIDENILEKIYLNDISFQQLLEIKENQSSKKIF